MKHRNLAIFIPHVGCGHRCSFCDQHRISGQSQPPTPENIKKLIETCVNSSDHRPELTQIAFFGGSFTCIPKEQMRAYLEVTKPFIERGDFAGIRISTRPDGITPEILEQLKSYQVNNIELGAQSMDPSVLIKANRGHTPDDTIHASRLIHDFNIELGLQMLIGLPGDTKEKAFLTAQKLAALRPCEMRLYPAVVFPGTELHDRYLEGSYQPLSVEQALDWTIPIAAYLQDQRIHLLKVGLHQADGAVAGAFHPAFGEMVRTGLWNERLKKKLPQNAGKILVQVQPNEMSIALGQKRSNIQYWADRGYNLEITIRDDPHAIKI